MTSKLALGIVVCLALSAQAANPAGSYVVTNLGDFAGGFDRSSAFDINSMGQVAGSSSAADGPRAFLWTPSTPNGTTGALTNLGFLPSGANASGASGINDRGQVVGNSGLFPFQHAFLWSPTTPNGTTGSMTEIGFLPGLANASDATAINAYGQVTGASYSDTNFRAYLWTPDSPNGSLGSMIELGDLPGGFDRSWVGGINSYGQVVGQVLGASGALGSAFLWTPSTPNGTYGAMINLGTLPGGEATGASSLNSLGQVIGSTTFRSRRYSFVWTPETPNGTTGTITDLGAPPAGSDGITAFDINARGQVVGQLNLLLPFRAFLWEPSTPNGTSGNWIDLNSLMDPVSGAGWVLQSATAINDIGQIVGEGTFDADGPGGSAPVTRGFLLTPVPEPATWLLALLALSPLLRRRG